ncbi:hypothetical protein [Fretibacter rubidus]|uniref:hypothetical protein n=1 Tax=Fretibacter rubidus TaxID=570162 RepID=UPI00352B4E91
MIKSASFALVPYALSLSMVATAAVPLLAATQPENGIWVSLCATNQKVFIDLGGEGDDTPPMPPHAKACHAICCQRDDGLADDSECEGNA